MNTFPPQLRRVPHALPLAPKDRLSYPFRPTTTQPQHHQRRLLTDLGTIKHPPLRRSHTDHYNHCADSPTYSLPTLFVAGVIVTDDYFGPPTPTIPNSTPTCKPSAQALSLPRSPPTSLSTHILMPQRQTPCLHTERGKHTFHCHDLRRLLLRPPSTEYHGPITGATQRFRHHHAHHATTVSRSRWRDAPPQDLPSRFIGSSSYTLYTTRVLADPQRTKSSLCLAHCASSRTAKYISACL